MIKGGQHPFGREAWKSAGPLGRVPSPDSGTWPQLFPVKWSRSLSLPKTANSISSERRYRVLSASGALAASAAGSLNAPSGRGAEAQPLGRAPKLQGEKKSLNRVRLCGPMDCSPPGSSSHGISQARILESVAISFSTGSSWPRDRTWVSLMACRRFTFWATSGMSLERLRFGSQSRACCRERNSTSRWNAREPPGRSVSKLAPSPHNTPRPRDLGRRGNAAIGERETPRREAASKEMHQVDPGGAAHTQPRDAAWSLLTGLSGLWNGNRESTGKEHVWELYYAVTEWSPCTELWSPEVILKLNKRLHTDLYIFHEVQW